MREEEQGKKIRVKKDMEKLREKIKETETECVCVYVCV